MVLAYPKRKLHITMTRKFFIPILAIAFLSVLSLSSCKNQKDSTASAVAPQTSQAESQSSSMENNLEQKKDEQNIAIEYRRTACFGTCPIFDLTIYDNGRAIYNGKNFVDMIGIHYTTASQDEISRIVQIAEKIRFFEMDDEYDNKGITDLPSIYVSIAHDGKLKTVRNRVQGPKELVKLYEQLDEFITSRRWESDANMIKN